MVLLILRKWHRGVQRSEEGAEGQRWIRTAMGEVLGDLIPSLGGDPEAAVAGPLFRRWLQPEEARMGFRFVCPWTPPDFVQA